MSPEEARTMTWAGCFPRVSGDEPLVTIGTTTMPEVFPA